MQRTARISKRLCGVFRDTYYHFVGHMFFKCDEMSLSTAFTVKTLLIFREYIFEILINTALPGKDFTAFQEYLWHDIAGSARKESHCFLTSNFCVYFACYPPKSFKIIRLACIWSKFPHRHPFFSDFIKSMCEANN